MLQVGIIGGAGYTAGELIRLLMHHSKVEINFVYSTSNAGNKIYKVHQDLIGSTELEFTNEINTEVDVLFLCLGHGNSKAFEKTTFSKNTKIIDLSNDFRLTKAEAFNNKAFVYGLPELNKEAIIKANYIANPGCFATAIQLALLPLAKAEVLQNDVHINAVTGATGAGTSLSSTTHFTWRDNNFSYYKPFTHQHLGEIHQTVNQLQNDFNYEINFMPNRGDFSRGIFATIYTKFEGNLKDVKTLYQDYYKDAAFTFVSTSELHLKQVVNTNKCLLHLHKHDNKLLITSVIDNLLKGASGQAVQNMNLMFGFEETTGLQLKANFFKTYIMKLFNVYPLFDITPVKAKDVFVYDEDNTKYLDLYGGHAVISIGHSHPEYVKNVSEQVAKLGFYSNSVQNPLQIELAKQLTQFSNCENYNLFLCNSGAEANENALKLASFKTGKSKVIAFNNSFHGRTSAAVAATDNAKIVAAINAQQDVEFIELGDIEAVEKALVKNDVCAVIIECIQGVGGLDESTSEFYKEVDRLCKKYNTCFIADEVQSGFGRTGDFFAFQKHNITPDIISIAKGMGNGFPIGGILIHPNIKASFGLLGTTFGGNHLACAASLAVLKVLKEEKLLKNVKEISSYFIEKTKAMSQLKAIKGRGLMLGLEFNFPIAELRKSLIHKHHIFTGSANNPNLLGFSPPLTIQKEHIDVFVEALKQELL